MNRGVGGGRDILMCILICMHMVTILRMQDFKAELERRIQEQKALDADAALDAALDADAAAGEPQGRGWLDGESSQIFDAIKVLSLFLSLARARARSLSLSGALSLWRALSHTHTAHAPR